MNSDAGAAAVCAPRATVLAHATGEPDDLLVQGKRILFGDIRNGLIGSIPIRGGAVRVVARGLSVPEGIVPWSGGRLLVVEQGLNRLTALDPRTGARQVVLTLRNTTGLEGVDNIAPASDGEIYLPDSPYGSLYRMDRRYRLHLITGALARPVDAISWHGGIAVADENANAIWFIRGGRITRLATVSTPDDVTATAGMLLAVTLGDGRLWEIRPHLRPLGPRFGQPQGLATLSRGTVAVSDSNANTITQVSGLAACR